MKKLLIVILFFSILTGCATTQKNPTAQNENIPWDNRVQTLSGIVDFDLKSMIAIRNQADAGSASLQWQQQNQRYHILIFGPLGTGSYELTGEPGKVELATSSGKRFYATSPESLLMQQTGWQLPVSNLYYWIRGLPVPNVPAEKNFDAYHHLILLKQQNWIIHYLNYTSVNHIDLPQKIFLENPRINVKIVVNQWQVLLK